jgi:hypothetical protein
MAIEPGPKTDQMMTAISVTPPSQPALAEVVSGPVYPLTEAHVVPRYSRGRLALAMMIACISDLFSVLIEFVPPLQLVIDLVTALLLFMVLGWRWLLLPALVAEAIPGISVFPVWLLVVISIAVAGNTRKS